MNNTTLTKKPRKNNAAAAAALLSSQYDQLFDNLEKADITLTSDEKSIIKSYSPAILNVAIYQYLQFFYRPMYDALATPGINKERYKPYTIKIATSVREMKAATELIDILAHGNDNFLNMIELKEKMIEDGILEDAAALEDSDAALDDTIDELLSNYDDYGIDYDEDTKGRLTTMTLVSLKNEMLVILRNKLEDLKGDFMKRGIFLKRSFKLQDEAEIAGLMDEIREAVERQRVIEIANQVFLRLADYKGRMNNAVEIREKNKLEKTNLRKGPKKGERVRFPNNPLTGEVLLDPTLVANRKRQSIYWRPEKEANQAALMKFTQRGSQTNRSGTIRKRPNIKAYTTPISPLEPATAAATAVEVRPTIPSLKRTRSFRVNNNNSSNKNNTRRRR